MALLARSPMLQRQQVAARNGCVAFRARPNRRPVYVEAAMKNSRTAELRRLLRGPNILMGPCCHDALSARLIEQAGFPYTFMSGFCTSGARLGAPDTGLISYAEMLDTGRYVNEATHSIPIIGDGDTGYGNAMNVKRTVKGYAQVGFAGILIEDQVAPKSCGHVRGKRVVPRDEAVMRIRAAVDARDEGADILIVARTDARQAVSLDEALQRAEAFAAAGADILFIDALESEEELRAFGQLGGAAAGVPKMANMLEGGGKTPVLPPSALQRMGFKLVAYPLSLLGVSIRAMQDALEGLREGRVPDASRLGTFADIQAAVGFPEYFMEEKRYAVRSRDAGSATDSAAQAPRWRPEVDTRRWDDEAASAPPPPRSERRWSDDSSSTSARPVEPEVVAPRDWSQPSSSPSPSASWPLPSEGRGSSGGSSPESAPVPTRPSWRTSEPEPSEPLVSMPTGAAAGGSDPRSDPNYRRNMSMRVKISDRTSGLVKLETRIPAGFLNGLSALVPQVSGFNVEGILKEAMGPNGVLPAPGEPVFSVPSGNDLIQIFLE